MKTHAIATPLPSAALARRGFTLAEILIAMLIVGLVMVAVATVLRTAMRSWTVGHDMTEVVQTARITQDVVLRDMHNIVYLSEGNYNQGFQRELMRAAQTYQADYTRNGSVTPDDRIDWEAMTPPIDLSFRATDSGTLDRLSLVRSHQSRFPGDPNTWGLRRVTYYVENKTLYRREDDPFGFRPSPMNESFFNPQVRDSAQALAEYFARPANAGDAPAEGAGGSVLPGSSMLPDSYQVAEPLCEGVEIFNITAGYFKEGEWREVAGWDSNARQYRQPPEISELTDPEVLRQALAMFPDRVVYDENGHPSMVQNKGQPDDLPGYLAIQLGVRGANGKGRLHSFTFFHSFPMGEERDVLLQNEDGTISLPDPDFAPEHGRNRRGRGRR